MASPLFSSVGAKKLFSQTSTNIIVDHLREYELHFPADRWDVFEGDVDNILRKMSQDLRAWHEFFVSLISYLMQEQVKQRT